MQSTFQIAPRPRQRKSAPRAKTGCSTCKRRRVKCDEGRPFCQRCIKFGIECGYSSFYKPNPNAVQQRKLLPIDPAIRLPSSDPLAQSPFTNAEEHQYFNLFCIRTGYDIFSSFDSGSTRRLLLESCHSNPAIRHAIIALGALDKTAELVQCFDKLSLTPVERDAAAGEHHQNALRQYVKAVKHMAADASVKKPDLRTMLLTCLLILAFESWTGNMGLAAKQVYAGIRLIQEWKERYTDDKGKVAQISPAPYVVEDELILIFYRLTVQHSFFADGHLPELHSVLSMEDPAFTRSMPSTFTDIFEAGRYYYSINRRGIYLITNHSPFLGHDTPKDSTKWLWAIKEQEEIQAEVWRFNKAFEPLLKKIEDGPQKHYALIIMLSMTIGYIGLSTHLSTDESIHDEYNPVYQRVVNLAKTVMEEVPCNKRRSNFCFDTRIVVPLWIVGLKCREPSIRRQAINFLLANPRREGIWDSVFAGKVLQWVMEVEEKYIEDGKVPGWARLAGVKWVGVELGGKRVELVCFQRVSADDETMVRRTKTITW